ncbi:MAG: hypothetical protein ACFFAS_04085 [Promethearchaeota archaeon]
MEKEEITLLIGWSNLTSLQMGFSFHGGNSTYTSGGAAEAARNLLDSTYMWFITDGGSS